jgi:hypothetical protein
MLVYYWTPLEDGLRTETCSDVPFIFYNMFFGLMQSSSDCLIAVSFNCA